MSQQRIKARVYKSRLNPMDAYDMCAPSVRNALANAAFDWSAAWALNKSRKLGAKAIVEAIAKGDAAQIMKDQIRVWGMELTLEEIGL